MVMSSVGLAALAAFNLVCTGTMSANKTAPMPDEPYKFVYRVDLDAEKWCDGECKATHKIASIQPTQITFEDSNEKDPVGGKSAIKSFVNRETGLHVVTSKSVNFGRSMLLIWKGSCERQEFTGFPKFVTKF